MRFITDGMLGKLTRWLRMLGYNVKYSGSLNDKHLVEVAKNESRLILTRDQELHKQATISGVDSFLVEGVTEAEKLADLAKHFNLRLYIDVTISRCPKCNARIRPVPKEKITHKVHKTTFSSFDKFWKCTGCGQVYWQGAHWKRIEKTLGKARELI